MAEYKINVFDNLGNLKTTIFDFQSLSILDTANDVGKWSIKSKTPYKQPFAPYDSAVFYRDGVYIYGGPMHQFSEVYDKHSEMWSWEVSGYGFNALLKDVLIYPADQIDSAFTQRYYTSSNWNSSAITDLINKNASASARLNNRPKVSEIISGAVDLAGGTYVNNQEPYRFVDLLKTCQSLAGNDLFILPHFDEASKKVTYYVTRGNEKPIIFSFDLGSVYSYKHTYTTPTYTNLITSYNSDDNDIWALMYDKYLLDSSAGPVYRRKEVLYKPTKEQFGEVYDALTLSQIGTQAATNYIPETDSIEITVSPYEYVYGYDRTNNTSNGWANDYKIGDPVKIILPNEELTVTVRQMKIDVSYGKESIAPGFGVITKGAFHGIYSNLKNLNLSVSNSNTGAV